MALVTVHEVAVALQCESAVTDTRALAVIEDELRADFGDVGIDHG